MHRDKNLNKIFTVSIIFLFIGANIIPVIGSKTVKKLSPSPFDRNTLYVGGTGPNNYSSIQEAINDSFYGDTVFVYDDSSPYYENVIINKSINLIGEDRDTTIIDSGGIGDVVIISADWVNISGFTIQNSSYYQAGIKIISNSTIITDNIIANNKDGIIIGGFINYTITNNIILNNTVMNNDYFGISFGGNNHYVTGNNITNNGFGINLGGTNNTIIGNKISSNNYNGIKLYGDGNIITGNIIISNKNVGILLDSCTNNTILKNNFLDNTIHTCFLYHYTFFKSINISSEEILKNTLKQNYWGRPRLLPKCIPGIALITILLEPLPSPKAIIIPIPWFHFDARPAKEPYDIR